MRQKGFTLVELLVAVAVFSLTVAAASGIFISALQTQRKSLASQQILDQTSYSLEYMGRALRMAKKEKADPPACLTADLIPGGRGTNYGTNLARDKIRFVSYDDRCQEFFLDGNQLKERKSPTSTTPSAADFGPPTPLTSNDVFVELFKVGPITDHGWSQDDDLQPRVTISLKLRGVSQKVEERPEIKIQTTVSQRDLDVQY
jgi:prepilin-type N-terminal cleavage/methylation domain-containing protein